MTVLPLAAPPVPIPRPGDHRLFPHLRRRHPAADLVLLRGSGPPRQHHGAPPVLDQQDAARIAAQVADLWHRLVTTLIDQAPLGEALHWRPRSEGHVLCLAAQSGLTDPRLGAPRLIAVGRDLAESGFGLHSARRPHLRLRARRESVAITVDCAHLLLVRLILGPVQCTPETRALVTASLQEAQR